MANRKPKFPGDATARMLQVRALYHDAAKEINIELGSGGLTAFQDFRQREHLAQINKLIRGLDIQIALTTQNLSVDAYRHGADLATWSMRKNDIPFGKIGMGNRIHTRAVNALSDQMRLDLLSASNGMKTGAQRILRKTQQMAIREAQIHKQIAAGIVRGESVHDATRRLQAEFERELGKGVRIPVRSKSGKTINFDPGHYSELVVRTQTREAVTAGTINFASENGVTLFRWSVHADVPDEACTSRQGKIFSTVEGTPFPLLTAADIPPVHPNCKHILLAVSEEILRRRGQYDRLAEISSQQGSVVDRQHYSDIVSGKAGLVPHGKTEPAVA